MKSILEKLFGAADNHAEDTGEPDHEVGDLQDVLRTAWNLMTRTNAVSCWKATPSRL
jgi:hypothetical protein